MSHVQPFLLCRVLVLILSFSLTPQVLGTLYGNGASEYPGGPVTVGAGARRAQGSITSQPNPTPQDIQSDIFQQGIASWYGQPFHGRLTANGETYNMYGISAAHKTLAFGTLVEVIDLESGKSVEVRINDRGPFVEGRIIDLSYGAARVLGLENRGLAQVALRILDGPSVREVHPRLRIQVASFRSRTSAESLVNQLKTNQLNGEIEIVEGGIFRVIIPLGDRTQARATLARLAALGFADSFVREGA